MAAHQPGHGQQPILRLRVHDSAGQLPHERVRLVADPVHHRHWTFVLQRQVHCRLAAHYRGPRHYHRGHPDEPEHLFPAHNPVPYSRNAGAALRRYWPGLALLESDASREQGRPEIAVSLTEFDAMNTTELSEGMIPMRLMK